jgi:hypothetical protein
MRKYIGPVGYGANPEYGGTPEYGLNRMQSLFVTIRELALDQDIEL